MICSDFTLVLNPSIDCHNYTNINNSRAISKVIQIMSDFDFTDSFRYLNNNVKCCSWRKNIPLKQARLDYFLILHAMMNMIDSCDIKPNYRSDHSLIEMKVSIGNFVSGRGTWKMNNSLHKNKD